MQQFFLGSSSTFYGMFDSAFKYVFGFWKKELLGYIVFNGYRFRVTKMKAWEKLILEIS
jgi:hypothetical protein